VSPRAGLDGRKISSPPGFDPGPSSPLSVAIPTELPGPHMGISNFNLRRSQVRTTGKIGLNAGFSIYFSVLTPTKYSFGKCSYFF